MRLSASDVLRNNVREKLRRGEVVSSMAVRLVRGIEIARIAKTAGFDSLYVDLEHGSLSLESTAQICMAAVSIGIAPFVRVPASSPEWIARVLDGGALGVIAPHIASVEQARAVVAAAKFAPIGQRSIAGGLPHLGYRSFPVDETMAAMNDATLVMLQFEDMAAIENADAIMALEGVDMVMVGFSDLSADMGIPGEYGHPRIREAMVHTVAACRRHGKYAGVGGLASRPDIVADFVKLGARYVSTGTDLAFLLSEASARALQVAAIAR
ncbi:MAG: aldolase [Betaproteobacteria bacterium]|nr:aldolase [Betaproteobacteria bacterium]